MGCALSPWRALKKEAEPQTPPRVQSLHLGVKKNLYTAASSLMEITLTNWDDAHSVPPLPDELHEAQHSCCLDISHLMGAARTRGTYSNL